MKTTSRYHSDFARRYFDEGHAQGEAIGEARGEAKGEARGEAKGEARAVLAVLDARGIDVPFIVREAIIDCIDSIDLQQLETWVRHALVVDEAEELLGIASSERPDEAPHIP